MMGYFLPTTDDFTGLKPQNPLPPDGKGKITGYRYYMPGIGRWSTRDPMGERAWVMNAPIIARSLTREVNFQEGSIADDEDLLRKAKEKLQIAKAFDAQTGRNRARKLRDYVYRLEIRISFSSLMAIESYDDWLDRDSGDEGEQDMRLLSNDPINQVDLIGLRGYGGPVGPVFPRGGIVHRPMLIPYHPRPRPHKPPPHPPQEHHESGGICCEIPCAIACELILENPVACLLLCSALCAEDAY